MANAIMKNCPWSVQTAMRTDDFLTGWAAAEAMDEEQLAGIAEKLRQASNRGSDSRWAMYAGLLYARLARMAADRGDRDTFRRAAMTVGGLVSAGRGSASKAVLLRLAEAATAAGQPDVAREYLRQSGVHGPDRDAVLAQIVVKMLEDGRVVEARKHLQEIADPGAAVSAWYATTKAEVSAPSARLSAVYEEIEPLSSDAVRSAALAGVAAALLAK
jgi:hypothetical protein